MRQCKECGDHEGANRRRRLSKERGDIELLLCLVGSWLVAMI